MEPLQLLLFLHLEWLQSRRESPRREQLRGQWWLPWPEKCHRNRCNLQKDTKVIVSFCNEKHTLNWTTWTVQCISMYFIFYKVNACMIFSTYLFCPDANSWGPGQRQRQWLGSFRPFVVAESKFQTITLMPLNAMVFYTTDMCRASNLLQVQPLFILVEMISCEHGQNLPRSARRRSFQRCLWSLNFETWLI